MSNKKPLVITIIVHYRSPDECRLLVNDLQTVAWSNHKIVVVDNQSPEHDYTILKQKLSPFTNTKLVRNLINNGYGGGINFGIEQTKHLKPDYFQIINTDTRIINPEYISDIIKAFSTAKQAALIGPGVLNSNGDIQNTIMPFFSLKSIVLFKWKHSNQSIIEKKPKLIPAQVINGVCFVAKAKCLYRVNGFDEEYFMYGEEHDLCYRLIRAGFKIFFWSGRSIEHYNSISPDKNEFSWRDALIRSNQVLFLKKHRSAFEAIVISFLFSVALIKEKINGTIFKDIHFFVVLRGLFFPRIINDFKRK